MVKKILIGIGVTAVIIASLLVYLNNRNRTLSPPGHDQASNEGLTVTVDYSRPSVRDRVMFGTEAEKALHPFGQYWRLGANEATEIEFNRDVMFGGKALKKGIYTIYAIPGESFFKIGINAGLDRWGYAEPDYDQDLFTIDVPVKASENTEQFTISFNAVSGGLDMIIKFSYVELMIPIRVAG